MHPIFRPIFQRQLRAFRAMQTDGRPPDWEQSALIESSRQSMFMVDDALDAAASAVGPDYTLRPDAKLLLGVNLQQLVAMPLLLAQQDEQAREELRTPFGIDETVRDDAVTIARAAKEQARDHRNGEREISAADILRGLSKVMEELRLKDWRLWDRNG
jgi:hypothetical protein